MKKEECTIGAEVYTEDGFSYRYTVESLPDADDIITVKSTYDGKLDTFHLDDLFLYSEEKVKALGAAMQAKVDEAKNAFEKAFAALREVQEFRDADGHYVSRYDLSEAGVLSFKELEGTIEAGGWSSSSLWC